MSADQDPGIYECVEFAAHKACTYLQILQLLLQVGLSALQAGACSFSCRQLLLGICQLLFQGADLDIRLIHNHFQFIDACLQADAEFMVP